MTIYCGPAMGGARVRPAHALAATVAHRLEEQGHRVCDNPKLLGARNSLLDFIQRRERLDRSGPEPMGSPERDRPMRDDPLAFEL